MTSRAGRGRSGATRRAHRRPGSCVTRSPSGCAGRRQSWQAGRRCACSTSAAGRSRTTRSSPTSPPSTSGSTSWTNPAAELLGPVEALPVEDASFDVVLCTQVLEHCDDPAQAVRELRRVTAPGDACSHRRTACRSTTRLPSTTGAGRTRACSGSSSRTRDWSSLTSSLRRAPRPRSRCCSAPTSRSRCAARRSRARPVWVLNRAGEALERAVVAARATRCLVADPEPPRRRRRLMRLFRRNALGVYAVYAAAIVSGLLVTPIVIHSIGTKAFGVWAFIGAVTIYLSILDFGVGPSIVRFAAEARGRGADEDLNAVASDGARDLRGDRLVTLPIGIGLAFAVPRWSVRRRASSGTRGSRRCSSSPRSPLAFPSGSSTTSWSAAALGPAEPRELRLHRALRGARRDPDAALRRPRPARRPHTRHHARPARRCRCSGCVASCPACACASVRLPRAAARAPRVQLLELPRSHRAQDRLLDRRDRRGHRARLGGAGSTRSPRSSSRSCSVSGPPRPRSCSLPSRSSKAPATSCNSADCCSRACARGTALMLLLALPLLLIPDLLIKAWIGAGYHGSYSVMAILAGVLLVHQPIYVLTQFLIARGRQRTIAIVSIAITVANLRSRSSSPGPRAVGRRALDARHRPRHARLGGAEDRRHRPPPRRPARWLARSSGLCRPRSASPRSCSSGSPAGGIPTRCRACPARRTVARSWRRGDLALRARPRRARAVRARVLAAVTGRRRRGRRLAARQVDVEHLGLEPPREHVPVELAPRAQRRRRELGTRFRLVEQSNDRVDERAGIRHEDPGARLAEVRGHLVVVGDSRHAADR